MTGSNRAKECGLSVAEMSDRWRLFCSEAGEEIVAYKTGPRLRDLEIREEAIETYRCVTCKKRCPECKR